MASGPDKASGRSQGLTHVDDRGAARIVDISEKPETMRTATASGFVQMDTRTLEIIAGDAGEGAAKGDVLGIARLAGIQAAKNTGAWIPLCHPLRLTAIDIGFQNDRELPGVRISALVSAVDRTGVEMEAMTAVSACALTIYDMCKAVDRRMVIGQIQLETKLGGRSGHWQRTPQVG